MIVDSNQLPLSGTGSRIFEGGNYGASVSCFVVEIAPGDGPQRHVHPYAEVFVIHEGEARFVVGETSMTAHAGQIVIAPADVPHAFINTGETILRSVNIHPAPTMTTEWLTSRGHFP